MPLTAKSFAFTLTWEIVKLVFPLFTRDTVLELELPAVIPVKVRLFGLVDNVTDAAVPVPLSANTFGEFGALLEMLTVPVCAPAVLGAKSTLNVAVLPAGMLTGVASPLTLKAPPLASSSAIVSAAVPVFVTVIA